jgi:HEAT repeat protein
MLAALEQAVSAEGDYVVRLRAADALGWIGRGCPGAVRPLIAALEDPNSNVRWQAADSLAGIGPAAMDAVPALLKRRRDEDEGVRQAGALKARSGVEREIADVLRDAVRRS